MQADEDIFEKFDHRHESHDDFDEFFLYPYFLFIDII